MDLLAYLALVVLSGYGMAIALVEKKRQWPIRRIHLRIKKLLRCLHPRLPRMLSCTVCTSFWTTLIADILLHLAVFAYTGKITGLFHLWTWPLSGFITLGVVWTVLDFQISLGAIADNTRK